MTQDETALAFTRLADALSDEILSLSDAEVCEAFPGRGARVAADAWRQMVRRIAVPDDDATSGTPHPIRSEPRYEEDKP